jgi:hypothetical protein
LAEVKRTGVEALLTLSGVEWIYVGKFYYIGNFKLIYYLFKIRKSQELLLLYLRQVLMRRRRNIDGFHRKRRWTFSPRLQMNRKELKKQKS